MQRLTRVPCGPSSRFRSLGGEDSLEKGRVTPVFLPGESIDQGSLADCTLQGHKVRHD